MRVIPLEERSSQEKPMSPKDELRELLEKCEDIQGQIADYNDRLVERDNDWLRRARYAHRKALQAYREKKDELAELRAASNFSRLIRAARKVINRHDIRRCVVTQDPRRPKCALGDSAEFDELKEAYSAVFKKDDKEGNSA